MRPARVDLVTGELPFGAAPVRARRGPGGSANHPARADQLTTQEFTLKSPFSLIWT